MKGKRMKKTTVIHCADGLIQTQLSLASNVLRILKERGFTPERVELDGYTRPTITVRYDGQCRRRQERGEAVQYAHGIDSKGRYEKYQMPLSDCRINWEVR
jgi:hypothetical protein